MTQISKVYVEWQYKNLKVDTVQNEAPPPFSIKDVSSLTVLTSIHEHQAMCLGSLVQFSSKKEAKGKKKISIYFYIFILKTKQTEIYIYILINESLFIFIVLLIFFFIKFRLWRRNF